MQRMLHEVEAEITKLERVADVLRGLTSNGSEPRGKRKGMSKEEDQHSSESTLGEDSHQWPSGNREAQAHHVGCWAQKDRSSATRTLGEGQGAAEESCLGIPQARFHEP